MRKPTVVVALFVIGCTQPTAVVENRAPKATVGADQAVFGGNAVTLNGSLSSDPDADALTFAWKQTAGATVQLSDATTHQGHFTAPVVTAATTLVFQLTVSDGKLTNTASASVTVNVVDPNNRAPLVVITAPTTVQSGAMVQLDGSGSTDPDGDSMTYVWTQSTGPALTLTNADQVKALFVAPNVTADTLFAFKLVVSDGKGGQAFAESSITVQPMTGNRP